MSKFIFPASKYKYFDPYLLPSRNLFSCDSFLNYTEDIFNYFVMVCPFLII